MPIHSVTKSRKLAKCRMEGARLDKMFEVAQFRLIPEPVAYFRCESAGRALED